MGPTLNTQLEIYSQGIIWGFEGLVDRKLLKEDTKGRGNSC